MASSDIDAVVRRRITFVEALGKGGFGAVFLADIRSRNNFAQRLAIKVLNKELSDNTEVVRRQRDEARLLAQLNHDHIVKVFDLIEIDDRPAVLMEYVPGVDASRLLKKDPIPVRTALEIIASTASALHAAYCTVSPFTKRPLRVIHRDIKPSNLLISEHGTLKVLDFGIARADFDREGRTRSVAFGTARYMAPEQWMNDRVTSAVDIFALGVTFVELLTGRAAERLPLRQDKFDVGKSKQISALRNPAWGRIWWQSLESLLNQMLAFDASERPSPEHVQEVCTRLAEEIGGVSLRRYANKNVPPLMAVIRSKMKHTPLLPCVDLDITEPQDPSILTGSKTAYSEASPPRADMGPEWWLQFVLAIGVVLSLWWFISV